MFLHRYRSVLVLPKVGSTILLMFLARLPLPVMGLTLTLHVVGDLGRSYGEAGLVGTGTTVGTALGAPSVGRMIDRYGLRRVVVVCGVLTTLFWSTVAQLPYALLLVLSLPAGLIALPMSSLARQFLTALVPTAQRRAAFSLDTVLAGVSYILAPTLAVLAVTQFSAGAVLRGIGVWLATSSVLLCATNLPTRTAEEVARATPRTRPRVRSWLDGRMLGAFAVCFGCMVSMVGAELSVIATQRAGGETAWTGVVIATMAVASIVGGIPHGAMRRTLPQDVLGMLLGLLTIPVGLFAAPWWVLGLALVPMALLTAPATAANSETISRLAPAHSRGVAMGLLDSSTRLGVALAGPAVGFVIDHSSPAWGFAAAGLGGLAFAGLGTVCGRRRPAPGPAPTASAPPVDRPV